MVIGPLPVLVLAVAIACQQDRRDSKGEVAARLPAHPSPVATLDSDVRDAQGDLAEGRPWLATRRLGAALATRHSPEAVLIAARAAAAWGGWKYVDDLLTNELWLATDFQGEGLEWLARSALERDDARDARAKAEAALAVPSDPAARATRLVLLARALDRLDQMDSSAATYKRAADALPLSRDWLLLRAAGVTRNADARRKLYAGVQTPTARARVPYTEAQTLERFSLLYAAAAAYDSVGDRPSGFRLRLQAARPLERQRVRAALLQYIRRDARGDDLERAAEVLEASTPSLGAGAHLVIARRAAAAGLSDRATASFVRVPASVLTDADVIAWARALVSTGRPSEAARRIAAHRFAAAAAPEAEYVRGHALVRARKSGAGRTALNHVISAHASTSFAADALYLLADLEGDAGRDASARRLYQRSCSLTPPGAFSDEACFRGGIISYATGDARRSAAMFDDVVTRFPNSSEALAATYWSGRAWDRAQNKGRAKERWYQVIAREPNSYYAAAASRRLGEPAFAPTALSIPISPAFQARIGRATALEQLGMDTEARYEYDAIEREAAATPALALGAGAALLESGQPSRAIRLGWRALAAARDSGKTDTRGYALAYPMLRSDAVLAQARANRLDPAVVAGIIRQESSWNPRAVSHAGAYGLMQVMPRLGEQIARSRRYPVWDPALLLDADVSLELGTLHLRTVLSRYNNLPRALAAYNAGESRVGRWSRRAGTRDPEVFVERIPFVETRDYVRIVMRNAEMYRSLYGLDKSEPGAGSR